MNRALWLLPIVVTLGIAALLHRGVADYAHLGRDTWPLIATARVMDLSDVFGLFTRELMHGIYPDGSFYRPLTSLTYALDHALYGEAPRGYHITDLLLFGVGLCGVVSLLRCTSSQRLGAVCAAACGVLVALHPATRDVVPLSARRADLLVLAALLWAVRSSLGENAKPLCAAMLCLLACAAKESGFVAPLLVFCAAWSSKDSWRAAARFAAPSLAIVALFFIARALVLGGLGGPAAAAESSREIPAAAFRNLQAVWMPRSALVPESLRTPGALLLTLLAVEALRHASQRRQALALGVAVALTILLPACSGTFEAWYALVPTAFLAVLVCRLAHDAICGHAPRRLALPFVLWFPVLLVGSPLFESENPWLRASTRAERFEETLDEILDRMVENTQTTLNLPQAVFSTREADGSRLRTVPLYAPYSLVGRELLRERNAPVRFHLDGEPHPSHEGEILILLKPRSMMTKD